MEWRTVKLSERPWNQGTYKYLEGVDSVLVNDINERYCYNDGTWTVENSEIYVQKGKPTLLITLGESWTYGEGTEVINHRYHKWDIHDRIEVTYSGKMARLLDSDLWTFGCPGNSNTGIFAGLFRILDNIEPNKYESIKVLVQMTACDRDMVEYLSPDHPLQPLRSYTAKFTEEEKVTIEEWFVRYDEALFGLLNSEIKRHSTLNLDVVVFKNFNDIWTKRRDYNFRIVETFWLKYNAAWHGVDLKQCYVMHPGFYKKFIEEGIKIVKPFDLDFVNKDFDAWEEYTKFLKSNNDMNHSDHPNQFSHVLWTKYLLDFTGWKSITKI
jgi:hypothetical protein